MKRGRFDHCRYINYLFRWQDYNIDLSDSEGVQREGQAAVYKIPVNGPKVQILPIFEGSGYNFYFFGIRILVVALQMQIFVVQ